MANNPFDRTNIGLRERPLSSDLNAMQGQLHRAIMHLAGYMLAPRAGVTASANSPKSGFLHDGLRVTPSSPVGMTVVVAAGLGMVYDTGDLVSDIGATDLEQVNDLSPFKPIPLLAPVTFAVPTAPGSPNSRIDIIEVRTARRLENAITRRQLDPGTESFLDHVYFKALAYCLDGQTGVVTNPTASTAALSYKIGTAANPGLVPATTAGYTKIAEILVPNGTTSVNGTRIVDRRPVLSPTGEVVATVRFGMDWTVAPSETNIGTALVTIREVIAPPGIEFGVDVTDRGASPAGTQPRAEGIVHVFGGQIVGADASVQVSGLTIGVTAAIPLRLQLDGETSGGGSDDTTVVAPLKATMQAGIVASGGPNIGVGQSTAMLWFKCWDLMDFTAAAPSQFAASLEHIIVTVNFRLRY